MSDRSELREFLEIAGQKIGSKKELAKALGVRPQSISRFLSGEYSPSIENCFLLADLTGEPILSVLRMAGKSDLADSMVKHFGERKRDQLKPKERKLLDVWDKLPQKNREILFTLMLDLVPHSKQERAKTSHVS